MASCRKCGAQKLRKRKSGEFECSRHGVVTTHGPWPLSKEVVGEIVLDVIHKHVARLKGKTND